MKRGSIDDPERWRRARAIFEAALELDPTARGAHLDRECGDDVSLRAEVLDLLAADAALAERTGTSEPGFLEETAASLVSLLETSRATAQRGSAGAGSTLSLPQLPFSWGPLTVEEQIGEGSFGRVFRAHDPTLRRDVALKLRPLDATGRTVDGEDHLEEARRLARLRHPNVIVVHGAEAHDGWAGIWTDLVPGEALDVALERGGPFSRESLLRVGLDLCRALRAVHGAGLVHGDVKTSNAMRDADGRVLLMDFGSGRSASDATDDDSPASERLPQQGTPVAMAPELFDGATPTPISDVYALGVLLYRLATGRYPIQARSVREQVARLRQERPIPLEEMRPDLPAGFARVVHRALSVDPTARPSSAADFEWQLAASLGAEDVEFAESDGASDSLPHYPTRFIGRATELRQLRALLAEPGVVTLVGAGGCGKTRVTTRVAREFQQTMGGVLWVDLAPLTAADDLLVAVARVAEVRDEAARSLLDAVGDRLREMGNLLVLDNAEHLVAEVGRLIETLRSVAPRLRILVTSRRRLAIKEERSCQLAPMSAPDANQAEAGRALLEWDAVRLFVDRARVGGEPLRLNPAATADVARIVRRVDGIPLAIEMAAARVATLGLGTVATKLEESFRLLRTRAAGAQRHHETLEASIAWSVQFLSGEEAALLRRLSVFAGGASLDAIEEVCADRESADSTTAPSGGMGGAVIARGEIADLLSALVEHSLVALDNAAAAEPRYRLLESVRQFAAAALAAEGRADEFGDRLVAWAKQGSLVHGRGIYGGEMSLHMAWFDRERDNLRVALERFRVKAAVEPALHNPWIAYLTHLRPYWYHRGYHREALAAFTAATSSAPEDEEYLDIALTIQAHVAGVLGDLDNAYRIATRALALSRTQEEIEPSVLTTLASICESRGELDDARRHLREALTLPKMSTMLSGKVVALSNLGVLEAGEGRLEEARALYESAYELAEQLHDLPSLAGVAANIAITRLEQGDAAGARPFAESSLREAKKSGSGVLLVMARRAAVLVALAHEERAEARALVVDVLDALENETRIESWDMAFDTILDYLEAVGSHEAAVGILATAEELYQSTGHHKQPAFRARRTDRTERLRASIGPERFATLLASGRSLSRQQAAVAARAAI